MWNTLVTWDPYDILSASDLGNNFDNVQSLISSQYYRADGRLTLTSGTPVTTTDVTGATVVYYTPYDIGSLIYIYDGSIWQFYTLTEQTLGLTSKIKGVMYDVFITATAGVLSLSSVAWKKVTATSSPTSGSSKVINMSDTGDLAIGMEVTVRDGSNSELAYVTAVVNNTSITVDTLTNSYTLPDIYGFNQRATALTTVNGIYVKSGGTGYRYLGTIRITDTTGQTEDSTSRRYVWNMYNRVIRPLRAYDATDSWTYSTASWRSANGFTGKTYGTGRCGVIAGISEDHLDISVNSLAYSNALSSIECASGIGLNKTDTNLAQIYGGYTGRDITRSIPAYYKGIVPLGHTYVQRLEINAATSITWYGDAGVTYIQTGMIGSVRA